jgi:hypothetical protein
MKFIRKCKLNRQKLKLFWFWLIGWFGWGKSLVVPVKCRKVSQNSKSLLGKAYYFSNLKSWKITSPLAGIVNKVYPNYTLQIINEYGLQILIDIQVNEKKLEPLDKILQCEVQVGQKINPRTVLFIIYSVEQINCIVVYIPWQPEILKEVGEFKKNNHDSFVEIYYRNPYTGVKFKRHGEY